MAILGVWVSCRKICLGVENFADPRRQACCLWSRGLRRRGNQNKQVVSMLLCSGYHPPFSVADICCCTTQHYHRQGIEVESAHRSQYLPIGCAFAALLSHRGTTQCFEGADAHRLAGEILSTSANPWVVLPPFLPRTSCCVQARGGGQSLLEHPPMTSNNPRVVRATRIKWSGKGPQSSNVGLQWVHHRHSSVCWASEIACTLARSPRTCCEAWPRCTKMLPLLIILKNHMCGQRCDHSMSHN